MPSNDKPRAPTPTILPTEELRPQAAPVDRYVHPAPPARSSLWDLAAGLSKFDEGLAHYVQDKQQASIEAGNVLGEAAFYKLNREGYAEAVRRGDIGANQSPAFADGYKSAEGSDLGTKLTTDLKTAYAAWPGKDGTDPTAFEAWLGDHTAKALAGQDDPQVLTGLLPQLHQAARELHASYQTDLGNATYGAGLRAHIAAATRRLDAFPVHGIADPNNPADAVTSASLWADIQAQRQTALATGLRADDFDAGIVDAVIANATQHHDEAILSVLDNAAPGNAYAMSDDPAYSARVREAHASIATARLDAARQAAHEQERIDRNRLAELRAKAVTDLAANPQAPLSETVLAEGSKLDPAFRLDVIEARRRFIVDGGTPEQPAAVMELYMKLTESGGDMRHVMTAMQDGTIRTPETARAATAFAQSLQDDARSTIQSDPMVREYVNSIRSRLAPPKDQWPVMQMPERDPNTGAVVTKAVRVDTGLYSDEALEAITDFRRALYTWESQHPHASPQARFMAIAQMGKAITDRINPSTDYEQGAYRTNNSYPDNPFRN